MLILITLSCATVSALTPEEELGKALFFDTSLSGPPGQSCAACHGPEVGYTGPDSAINAGGAVYEGAVVGRFGNRKPPSAAYAGDSPVLNYDVATETWTGGMFWDGRATGFKLGDPLAEQALGPFLNPLEQNNPSAQEVCDKVKASSYYDLYETVWGPLDNTDIGYENIGRSIAAYERSNEVSAFTSRYDAYLKGGTTLTATEQAGLALFEGKAMCSSCHTSQPGPGGEAPLFTDFTYDNLGVPRNPENPFYNEPSYNPLGDAWVDRGLGGFLESAGYPDAVFAAENGAMKVPTLRNVDKRPDEEFVKAYGHNGYFKSLEEIVHFYNTRDVLPQCSDPYGVPGSTCWPAPEVSANINTAEIGNLGLTTEEEASIVAFLKTLTDECTNTVSVIKFYDANANGIQDTGEQKINGWKYSIDGSSYLTPESVSSLPPGTYTVTECLPRETSWMNTTPTSVVVTFDGCSQTSTVQFGNLCKGPGGGLTPGYWSNKNGQSDMNKMGMTTVLTNLGAMNLKDNKGADFDPTTYKQFKGWLQARNAVTMSYQLSAHLAAMQLNVWSGHVNGDALIYVNPTLGFKTINWIITEANTKLGQINPDRMYLEQLKSALSDANNNKNFVQPGPCPFSFAETEW